MVNGGRSSRARSPSGGARPDPGPYQAETIPITVEDDYIVVNLDPVRPPRPPKPAKEPKPIEETA